jgi:putative restriction endonuclease
MPVSFCEVTVGGPYSRNNLADLWGCASHHAIACGVVTPRDDNKIILFVTEEKQSSLEQYADRLVGPVLHWEGPNDHFAEERMVGASASGDEIHLFYRSRHHSDFVYMGQVVVLEYVQNTSPPSQFKLKIST